MPNKDNVIDSALQFRVSDTTREQRTQQRLDGKAALENLSATRKLCQKDRERIAGQIGLYIQVERINRQDLAEHARLAPKELYRLVLRPGEVAPAYRLRPNGDKYARLIRACAELSRADLNDLGHKLTYGSDVHPSHEPARSEDNRILRKLYDLADGIDEEFGLLDKFRAIAAMKRALDVKDHLASWPEAPDPDDFDPRKENPLRSSFWKEPSFLPDEDYDRLKRITDDRVANGEISQEQGDHRKRAYDNQVQHNHDTYDQFASFVFTNRRGDLTAGHLPHLFLGFRVAAELAGYIGLPEDAYKNGAEYEWLCAQLQGILGSRARFITEWDESNRTLLFNGQTIENLLYRIDLLIGVIDACAISPAIPPDEIEALQQATLLGETVVSANDWRSRLTSLKNPDGTWVHSWMQDDFYKKDLKEGIYGFYLPGFVWLCLYPNKELTGLTPIILTTNYDTGSINTVELVNEDVLSGARVCYFADQETLWTKIRCALSATEDSNEPLLMKEWRRTAEFINFHPLIKQHEQLVDARDYIKNWREQQLRPQTDGQ